MSLKGLAGQTAVYGASSIVARLLNYLLTPYLTRVLTTGEFGVYTDIYAVIPFLLVILTMGMETGYFRFAGKAADEREKRDLFASVWGGVLLAAVLFFAAVCLFIGPVADLMRYQEHHGYVYCMAALVMFDVAMALPFARLREQGRAKTFVALRVLSIVVNLLLTPFFLSVLPRLAAGGLFAWMYRPEFGIGYAFTANLIASAVTFAALLFTVEGIRPKIRRSIFAPVFLYSLPLLISGIAGTANEFIDRQMIKYLMPPEVAMSSLGIYGAALKIAVVMALFTQMYRLAAEPYFLSSFRQEDFARQNAEALKYFVAVSLLILLGITFYADLFALIVGADFREGLPVLPIILLSNMLIGVTLNLSFWYKQSGRTVYSMVVTGSGLVVMVVAALILVPRFGYFGAALSNLASWIVSTVISYRLNCRFSPMPCNMRRISGYFLLAALLFVTSLFTRRLAPVGMYASNTAMLLLYILVVAKKEKIRITILNMSPPRKRK